MTTLSPESALSASRPLHWKINRVAAVHDSRREVLEEFDVSVDL